MNVRTPRAWTRAVVSALALVAAGALVAVGSPAYADGGADLALIVSDKKIATDSLGKTFLVKVLNQGPDAAEAFSVEFDLAGLDASKVTVKPLTDLTGCEATDPKKIVCDFGGLLVEKDVTVKIPFELSHTAGTTGAAGSFDVKVIAETDPDPSNNEATVNVEIPGSGVDLGVFAFDVTRLDEQGNLTDEPVPPGESSIVLAGIVNQGDKVADGVKVTVKLPEHVTFAEVEPGCSYSSDNRTVTCDYQDLVLVPERVDLTAPFATGAFFPVTVAEDAPGPVKLTGGTFSAAALGESDVEEVSPLVAKVQPKLPDNLETLGADDLKDIDLSDNTDDFIVFVGAPVSGGGGGGGGLPVTGVKVGLIAGIGGAIVAVGAVLLLLARRRRVVPATPGDDSPTV